MKHYERHKSSNAILLPARAFLFTLIPAFALAALTLNSCGTPESASPRDSWQELADQAERFQQEGKLPEAEKKWQECLAAAEGGAPCNSKLRKSQHALAQLEFNLGNYKQAQDLYAKLVACEQPEGNTKYKSLAWNLSELGDAYYWQGNYEKAVEQYQRSADIYEENGQLIGLASSIRKLADSDSRLNKDIESLHKYNRAEMYARAALANPALEAYYWVIIDQLARIAAGQAELCKKTNHPELALKFSMQANERWLSLSRYSALQKETRHNTSELAEIFRSSARKPKDQTTFTEAAAPDLVRVRENLALAYCHLGVYGESEMMFARIIELFNEVARENNGLQSKRAEFVTALYKQWHSCHEQQPVTMERLGQPMPNESGISATIVENPYLREFRAIKHRQDRFEESLPLSIKYSRAIPTLGALELIKKHQPLVEAGAGTGYWASLLRKLGIDIVAYDPQPKGGTTDGAARAWTEIKPGGAEKVSQHADRTLFICSPPAGDPFATDALSQYKGKTLIYVGEPEGLSCADRTFFKLLLDQWQLKSMTALPQWPESYDVLFLYERKPAKG